jgi:DNA-binding NarL/FixJ family response regulator
VVARSRRIRVLLVEDNPMLLRQVSEVLPDDVEIVGTLESGAELNAAIEASAPDVIVLDITLPGDSGLTLAARLTAQGCTARIVFLTMHLDPDYVTRALAVGACGYVVKLRLAFDLEPALRSAVEGRRFVSPVPELSGD